MELMTTSASGSAYVSYFQSGVRRMPDSPMISCLEGVAEAVGVEVGVAPEVAGRPWATVVAGVGAGAEVVAVVEADLTNTYKRCMLCMNHLGLQKARCVCMPWHVTMAASSVSSCLGSTGHESGACASTPLLRCCVSKFTAYLETVMQKSRCLCCIACHSKVNDLVLV